MKETQIVSKKFTCNEFVDLKFILIFFKHETVSGPSRELNLELYVLETSYLTSNPV